MTFNLEPVKRDGNNKLIANYTVRNFYEKLAEEMFEAHTEAVIGEPRDEIKELLHIMTVCATRIDDILKYKNEPHLVLANLQNQVIRRNRERGYFEEAAT